MKSFSDLGIGQTGFDGESLPWINTAELMEEESFIVGNNPIRYGKDGDSGEEKAYIDVELPNGGEFTYSTTSKILISQVKEAEEAEELPFRASLKKLPSKKNPGRKFLTFA